MDTAVRQMSAVAIKITVHRKTMAPKFVSRSASQIAPMDIAFVHTSASAMKVIDYWKPAQTFANLFVNSLA